MSFATYPRKGSITRSNIKLLLESDAVFNQLSDAQQSVLIDASVQRIAAFRNKLSKTDFDFDTVGNADIDVETMGYTKYARYAIINASTTYEGTTYDVDIILVEQGPTGFANTINSSRLGDVVIFNSTGDEFTNAILWDAFSANVIITRVDDQYITVDVTDASDVTIIEIFKR
jgi:hypothetical protein